MIAFIIIGVSALIGWILYDLLKDEDIIL